MSQKAMYEKEMLPNKIISDQDQFHLISCVIFLALFFAFTQFQHSTFTSTETLTRSR